MRTSSNAISQTSKKPSAIKFDGVSAGYGNFTVLENISLEIEQGAFVYLVGPNGAGKSTLIRLLVNLLEPFSGTIEINTKKIGFLPQSTSQKRDFPITVKEAIYTGFVGQKLIIGKDQDRIIESWLEKMEIPQLKNNMMSELSGGQQQRVFLIRALISNPSLLILDEPTSALDTDFKAKFYEIINELNDRGATVIFVTHDLHETLKRQGLIMRINRVLQFFGDTAAYKERFEEQQ